MRSLPDQWPGRERVQWACALMELLGERTLDHLPLLMSGLRNVETSAALFEHAIAIRTAREVVPHYTTRRAILHAANEYREHLHEGGSGSYDLDPKTLTFSRLNPMLDAKVQRGKEILSAGLPHRLTDSPIADPERPMAVRPRGDQEAELLPVDLRGLEVPPPPRHDLTRTPIGRIEVAVADLLALARELDTIDRRNPGWRPGNWRERLDRAMLKVPHDGGLRETGVLVLDGLKHLLGMPGSGKTTLLVLLSLFLARNGYRVALFFTSIEVSRQYMEVLARYDAKVGMLVGQGKDTRRRHADRIAEAIAAEGDKGFGRTAFGADLFAENCVLSAFSRDAERAARHFANPPCDSVLQEVDGKRRFRLCPLWSRCGRNKAPRELAGASIWVGHVRSMDTQVPQHAADEQLRYFELIAETFDAVIFDECDMTQKVLDDYGAAALSLSGAEGGVHQITVDQVLERLAGEENYRLLDPQHVAFARSLTEFGTHSYALVHTLQRFENDQDSIVRAVGKRYEHQLLTTNRIITELLYWSEGRSNREEEGLEERHARQQRVQALCEFWESSIYAAFFDRNNLRNEPWEEADSCARVLGFAAEELKPRRRDLVAAFRAYLAEDTMASREDILTDVKDIFLDVTFRERARPAFAASVSRLLVMASFMILAYKRIVFGARELAAPEAVRDALTSVGVSRALQKAVPINALGALSGVRYHYERVGSGSRDASTVRLSYLVINGAPRMLMHRFHELYGPDRRGPNVLLTSATSYLEASPAYHVEQGPHYVLSPKESEYDPKDSRYYFRPVPNPNRRGEVLRFSGAGQAGSTNLKLMLEELVRGGTERSEIYGQINTFDVRHGVKRKAAIVVNSYDQVRLLKRDLDARHPRIGEHTVGVVSELREGERPGHYATPAQVEALGDDPDTHILIFPMLALNRGVNVVFTQEPRKLKAAIGAIYFLTRPHPTPDDLGLLLSLAARATQRFDAEEFSANETLADMTSAWRGKKTDTFRVAARLLQEPLMASRLGKDLFEAFTANQMVPILQTIGRGMRGGSPIRVFFVDAAWAPGSARGEIDGAQDSMLVMMRHVLEACVQHRDPVIRETYRELYEPFLQPLRGVKNVNYPATLGEPLPDEEPDDGTLAGPSAYFLEDPEEFQLPRLGDDRLVHNDARKTEHEEAPYA